MKIYVKSKTLLEYCICKNYEVWARMLGLFINTKFNCTSVHNNDKTYTTPLKVIQN